jgi:glucose-6-phosphate 1-dehydrogenase
MNMANRPSEDPSILIIFGGTGDLSRRKLLPALGRMASEGLISDRSHVVGVATNQQHSDESFRELGRESMAKAGLSGEAVEELCAERLHYQSIARGTQADFQALAERLDAISAEHGIPPRRTFFLALPTSVLGATIQGLGSVGLNRVHGGGWTRVVVEKPFGYDLGSAQDLVATVREHFEEKQIYRIDHYLGKETVQNLFAFRFGNTVFESVWHRDRIASVEIMVAEELGVGTRAGYYDKSGALRDMVQNHLTQLLTLVAMEVPPVIAADSVRYEKTKVLQSIASIAPSDVIFGQYAAGEIQGESVPGYLEADGVAEGSQTETFVAAKIEINNWRWQGVPFYLRTGKRMGRRSTRIGVHFKRSPVCMFESEGVCDINSNVMLLKLQPDEGFSLFIDVKKPASSSGLERIPLSFSYGEHFDSLPDAYQTLLIDVLEGDQTLFVHSDEVLESWRLFDPLLRGDRVVHSYPAGSWGPSQAEHLGISERDLMRSET